VVQDLTLDRGVALLSDTALEMATVVRAAGSGDQGTLVLRAKDAGASADSSNDSPQGSAKGDARKLAAQATQSVVSLRERRTRERPRERATVPTGVAKSRTPAGFEKPPTARQASAVVAADSRATAAKHYSDGLRQLLMGRAMEAIQHFNQAIRVDRRYAVAYRGLGLAHERRGQYGMARAAYERYLILRPAAGDAPQIRERIQRTK
jgi:Flp pilus assembly protein TadD